MTPANERKAKERQAKRDAGLVRVEVWVPREMVEVVKLAVDQMTKPPGSWEWTAYGVRQDGGIGKLPKATTTP